MNTKALKQKILDLAIHGKLLPLEKVEKIRKEEPASVLLEKIRAEKQEKIAKGELKKDKNDSFIFVGDDKRHYEKFSEGSVKDIEDEIPFDVPDGWSWCRLGEICELNPKNKLDDSLEVSFIPMNLIEAEYSNKHGQEKRKWKDIKKGFTHFSENDVAVAKISPCFENRKSVILKNLINGFGAGTTELFILRPDKNLLPKYLLWITKTNSFINTGVGNFSGVVGQQRLQRDVVEDYFLPLPPLNEQQLIVAEIEKIFAQIDLLEQNKTDLQTAIKQAKSKILDLAIHGKLVPQDPNDEPASVLLEKIRAEKEAKIAKGELKRDKNDSYIYKGSDNCHYQKNADGSIINIEEEIPFDVPESWCWCRLGEICELKGGKRIPAGLSATKEKTHHIYIRVTDMKNNSISDDDLVYIDENIFEKIQRYTINKNDLYLTIAGTIGRVGIVPEKFDGMNLTENALKLTDIKINKNFLMNILNTSFVQDYFASTYHQVAMPKLSLINASKTLILLPPLSEQTRIVAKIEELFELFDKIQSNIL